MQILRVHQVSKKIGLSRATIYRLLKIDPTFPKPQKLAISAIGWQEQDIDAWIASKKPSQTR
jgi:prophage regulatory protein